MKQITLVDIPFPCLSVERRSLETQDYASVQPHTANPDLIQDRRIVNCLKKMTLSIQHLSREKFIQAVIPDTSSVVIFVCNRESLLDSGFKSAFLQHLQRFPEKINLCLIPASSACEGLDLIKLFDDFICWPCSSSELSMRLQSYINTDAVLDTDLQKSEFISRFSKLNLSGTSDNFLQVLCLIEKIARHQATVLIQGETGTGKENAARAIHYLGNRAACPFVPINCATIPDDLLESELFGHEKGAFTDAKQNKEGLVEVANGGSLFLDEVDSLSAKAQAALLRFLQTQEYRPVGSKKMLRANVRIIAATNADLKSLSNKKIFREDLFFRLNVLGLTMPPLRDRKPDIPIIAESLMQRFAKEYDLPIKLLSQQSLRYLQQQSWPGNVREFENTLLRSFLLSTGKYLDMHFDNTSDEELLSNMPDTGDIEDLDSQPSFQDAKAIAIESFEKNYLTQVMKATQGNVTLAAKIAGKERRALGKLLQKYQIDKYQYR